MSVELEHPPAALKTTEPFAREPGESLPFDLEPGDPHPAQSDAAGPEASAPAPRPARPSLHGKPSWLKVKAPGGAEYRRLKQTLRQHDLYTVCEEARCPNVGECWSAGTATVMILGHTCTRGCRFCAVTTGNPRGAVDPREPEHVARAIEQMRLKYTVLTMVDRDDLLDGGAEHVGATVRALRRRCPELMVETLVGDFRGRRDCIETVVESGPDVYAHNLEVTRALTGAIRDARCSYDVSLAALEHAKRCAPERLTKSSLMVGLGETDDEIIEAMRDLQQAKVDVVTLGQYLRPTPKHAPVVRYVTPEQFAEYERVGKALGFLYVASGPLVRSSYHAAEAFIAARGPRASAPLPEPEGPEPEGPEPEGPEPEGPEPEEARPDVQPLPSGPVLISAQQLVRRR